LQLDGHMLEDVPEPRTVIFPHASEEAAGLAVGAPVFGQAGQGRGQRIDKPGA
jgi:hypothetical protein